MICSTKRIKVTKYINMTKFSQNISASIQIVDFGSNLHIGPFRLNPTAASERALEVIIIFHNYKMLLVKHRSRSHPHGTLRLELSPRYLRLELSPRYLRFELSSRYLRFELSPRNLRFELSPRYLSL